MTEPTDTVETARERVLMWYGNMRKGDMLADVDALIEAARADERSKWDAVKHGYVDAAATIENEFRAFRENLETFVDERAKAQPESALRAALAVVASVLHSKHENHEQHETKAEWQAKMAAAHLPAPDAYWREPIEWCSACKALARATAALDGAPREPSVEEVERAVEAMREVPTWEMAS